MVEHFIHQFAVWVACDFLQECIAMTRRFGKLNELLLGDRNILAIVKRVATVRCTPVPFELVEHLSSTFQLSRERIALVRNITRDSKIRIVDITGRLDRFAQVCKVWEKRHVLARRSVFLPVAPLSQSIIWDGNRESIIG